MEKIGNAEIDNGVTPFIIDIVSSTIPIVLALLFLLIAGFFITLTIILNRRVMIHKSEIQNIKDKQNQIHLQSTIETQELERERIGSDIHDDLGPLLSILKYKVSNISKYIENKSKLSESINKIKEEIDTIIHRVRQISKNISPVVLKELGLDEALQYLIETLKIESDIIVDYKKTCQLNTFSIQKSLAIYRIIQEGLNNILAHSKATNICISIENKTILTIIIKDNGVGFNMNMINKGLGIKNISARVKSLNGEFMISSNRNGTILIVKIPTINE